MEKEKMGVFRRLLEFWSGKSESGKAEKLDFWKDTEKKAGFAESGAEYSLLQQEVRKTFWGEPVKKEQPGAQKISGIRQKKTRKLWEMGIPEPIEKDETGRIEKEHSLRKAWKERQAATEKSLTKAYREIQEQKEPGLTEFYREMQEDKENGLEKIYREMQDKEDIGLLKVCRELQEKKKIGLAEGYPEMEEKESVLLAARNGTELVKMRMPFRESLQEEKNRVFQDMSAGKEQENRKSQQGFLPERMKKRKSILMEEPTAGEKRSPIPLSASAEKQKKIEKKEQTGIEKATRKRAESINDGNIDIEKIMNQITKRLWEERESSGRRLR